MKESDDCGGKAMKKRRWVVTLVSLITTVCLLLTATPAYAKGPPPEQPGPAKQFRDANKNKVFDNLEKRMAPAGTQQPFGVIVQFNKPLGEIDFPALKRQGGPFSVKYEYPSVNAISTTLTKGQIIAATKHDLVKQIEYNGEVHAFLDTATLWFGVEQARTDFDVDGDLDGNSTSYSENDLVIAVIDTGIDATHMDLDGGKVIGGWDFVGDSDLLYDDHGHGTHVASIAAGEGQANPAYRGVAPGAALVSVKTLDSNADGTWEHANAGIQWVIDNKDIYGIDVMNISWGAGGSSDGTSVTEQLVDRAVGAGIVAAVSAGNDGPGPYTIGVPAAAATAITVGAMADVEEGGFFLADFSSRGPTADGRIKPDISAPGWDVMAAKYDSTDEYTEMSGTSMAAPFVAGVAALMLDADSSLQPNAVKTTLMGSPAVDWGPSGPDVDYGAGRLDAYEAIRVADGGTKPGPAVPDHQYVAGSLGKKNKIDWHDINIASTAYPIAITMIMPDWESFKRPDFDMRLDDPNGEQLISSAWVYRQETITWQPSVPGTYKLKVWAYAGNGPYFFDLSADIGVPGPNEPPVAVIAGDLYSGTEDVAILFDGSGTDPDGDPLTYSWHFGDGATGTGEDSSHTYLWGGDFTVTLDVSDGRGGTDTATSTATVAEVNDQPVADPNGPYAGIVGDPITFDGSRSYDFDNEDGTDANDQTLSYSWTFGDDTIGSGVNPTHTYSAAGTYPVTLVVSDGVGAPESSATEAIVTEPTQGVSVIEIDPNSVGLGESVPVTITGSGFQEGASVSLEDGEGPTPKVSNAVVSVNSGTITATISTKSGGPPRNRYWDVRVTNPDASTGVLEDGFVVVP
jgi:serine protease AprX